MKAENMGPELGVIEGYFGRPWHHEDRKRVLTQLRELGYSSFHHAPKADGFLRRRWRESHPPAALAQLADLSAHCRSLGMRFGIGLSPVPVSTGRVAPWRRLLGAVWQHPESRQA